MSEQTEKFGVRILCYCLMTNHFHLLAVPESATALASAIGEAHRRYAWQLNRRIGATGYLFQGRFASCPLDESHLGAAARYVLLNPVRARLVDRPVDYRWSSAAFHAGAIEHDVWIERNDLLGLLPTARAWLQLMESEASASQHERLRQATHTGRPGGNAEFIAHAEQICGRDLTPKKAGRKTQNK